MKLLTKETSGRQRRSDGRVLGRWEIVLIRRWTQKQKAGPPRRRDHPNMKLYPRPRILIRFGAMVCLQFGREIMFAVSCSSPTAFGANPFEFLPAQAILACKTLPAVRASSVLQLPPSSTIRSIAPPSTFDLPWRSYPLQPQ
ncbi:hypothetical protein ASPBRDRAFT_245213 [Aspergillus brasiliensis CBS 101740]|uniref:Uncharacterized protein n=1 Tax=Aspergillus brasiliensis (strain CBS 101740 / IMI 381727 / IBT 21946) TaxID=767769 RepID=A0A1L9V180_ASPBC|nr:hypothetical protein ASPBRDRAFT_245213 [Aspergillus brasiliensis CBS 101740]